MLAKAKRYEEIAAENSTILLVDDEEAIRQALSLALEFGGYQVFTASNGQEAIEMLRDIPRPGLILLDLMMPIMDGWEFIEAIEKGHEFTDIPVAIITAFSNKGSVKGAATVIQKPVELNELLRLANEYCRHGKGEHA